MVFPSALSVDRNEKDLVLIVQCSHLDCVLWWWIAQILAVCEDASIDEKSFKETSELWSRKYHSERPFLLLTVPHLQNT